MPDMLRCRTANPMVVNMSESLGVGDAVFAMKGIRSRVLRNALLGSKNLRIFDVSVSSDGACSIGGVEETWLLTSSYGAFPLLPALASSSRAVLWQGLPSESLQSIAILVAKAWTLLQQLSLLKFHMQQHPSPGPMQSNTVGKTMVANNAAKNVTAKSTITSLVKIWIVQKNKKQAEPSVVNAEPQTALVMHLSEDNTASLRRSFNPPLPHVASMCS